jgi:hypothetical protein
MRNCVNCSKPFVPALHQAGRQRFCSMRCQRAFPANAAKARASQARIRDRLRMTTRFCAWCKEPFHPGHPDASFCSARCSSDKMAASLPKKTCRCGVEFQPKRTFSKHCSQKCKDTRVLTCAKCGSVFRGFRRNRFCEGCRGGERLRELKAWHARNPGPRGPIKPPLQQTCDKCGVTFVNPKHPRQRIHFCSKQCHSAWRSEHFMAMIAAILNDPERCAQMMARLASHNQRRWADPAQRALTSEMNRKRWRENPAYVAKMKKTSSETLLALWKNPAFRAMQSIRCSALFTRVARDPVNREKARVRMTSLFASAQACGQIMDDAGLTATDGLWFWSWEDNKQRREIGEWYRELEKEHPMQKIHALAAVAANILDGEKNVDVR